MVAFLAAPVGVSGGQFQEVGEMALTPGGTIRGRVVNAQGVSVAHAEIRLGNPARMASPSTGVWPRPGPMSAVGSSSRVCGPAVPAAGDGHRLGVRQVAADVASAGSSGLTVAVARAAKVTGLVLGADGMAAPDAQVQAVVRARLQNYGYGDSRRSGPDGRFALHNLGAGKLHVTAMRATDIATAGPLDLDAEGEAQVTLRLAPGGQVSGEVRTSDGKPLAGMRVTGEFARSLTRGRPRSNRQPGPVLHRSVPRRRRVNRPGTAGRAGHLVQRAAPRTAESPWPPGNIAAI